MYWIISTIVFIITIFLLKSTYVTQYYTKYNYKSRNSYDHTVVKEGNYRLTIIKFILFLIGAFIPGVNIIMYLCIYVIHIPRYLTNIENIQISDTTTYVNSLRTDTSFAKLVRRFWKVLNTPI